MSTGNFACPVDGTKLAPMERQGIEIDYCPSCRGVWLDRGELDKIIERSEASNPPPPPEPMPPSYREAAQPPMQRYDDPYRGHHAHPYDSRHKHKKRKSFLEELFD